MIRINLLPQTRKSAGDSLGNQMWAGIYLASVLVLSGALAFLYLSLSDELNQAETQNAEVTRQVAQVTSASGNLEEVKAALEQSTKLEEVVTGLLDARSGPARMLMELSGILSQGKGPTVDPEKLAELRKDNPQAGYSAAWDPRRLWITSFSETERVCAISGQGKNNEDVAEFLQRLEVSELFEDVSLMSTTASSAQKGAPVISFELACKVRY